MLTVISLVLVAACCHAIWNAYVKVSEDRLAGLVSINLIGAASGLLMIPFVPVPDAETWKLIGFSVPVHIFYKLLLARAYRHGDLSHVYPLMRGIAPLLVALTGVIWLDETLRIPMWAGIGLISAGILLPALREPRLLARAEGIHYYTPEGRPVLDGISAELQASGVDIGAAEDVLVEAIPEAAAEAPHGDLRAFAVAAIDRHAGDTLQRFRQVGVGELADIFGRNGIDHTARIALDVDRAIKAGVNWFDTAARAANGKAETNLGKILKDLGQRLLLDAYL